MSVIAPARGVSVRRLGVLWCVYEFFDEFVLLYALETLLFLDTGLSTGEITSLLVIWSLTSVILEVPSGVLADVVPRRLLMAVGPVLRSAGFALWVAFPSYPSFAIGFMLWGVCGALQSGATEALMYENLQHAGAQKRYASFAGRARSCGTIAVLASMLLAPTVFGAGGYSVLGAASAAAGLVCVAVVFFLPEFHSRDAERHEGLRSYMATLRAGVSEVRTSRVVLVAAVLLGIIPAVWGSLEEFVALLANDFGASEVNIPYLVAAVTAGITVGMLLAGPASRLGWRWLALGLGTAAILLALGSLSGTVAGFAALVPAFAMFSLAGVVAEARLQDAITGPARATVTSLAGLGQEGVSIALFLMYAMAVGYFGHGVAFAIGGLVYLPVAVVLIVGARRFAAAGPTS